MEVPQRKKYDIMKHALQEGQPVQFQSSGNSLAPLVWSGDTCFLWPVPPDRKILPGDIVFAHVQPRDRYYVHLVWSKEEYTDPETKVVRPFWTIGNNKKGDKSRVNGWVFRQHIFGYLVKTQRGLFTRQKVETS